MKVKEIMASKIVSIKPDDNAQGALVYLFKMKISGLPVIDTQGRLVGMFTEKDILTAILPSYIEKVGRFVYEENPKSIKKKFEGLVNLTVSQLMRKDVVTVDENASLCEVAHLILTQKVRRIPVLNKEKRVVGIIVREDIVKAYAREAGWEID
ncbi:MAG: CBS domain-containing protein [Candidatus Omnitrophica bacterium]|nr:CBS domain-containing protein [Candidatus Omnitrophota bacterium]